MSDHNTSQLRLLITQSNSLNLGYTIMCALRVRVHNNSSFLEKNFSEIEKVLTAFSIPEKIFQKINDLMCSLRHTLTGSIYIYIYIKNWRCQIHLVVLFWTELSTLKTSCNHVYTSHHSL